MTRIDWVLWTIGYLLFTALSLVLVQQRRYLQHPWFCGWIFICGVSHPALLMIDRFATAAFYSVTFRALEGLDCLLQVSVIFEFARLSLADSRGWLRHIRVQLAIGCVAAVSIAAYLASSADIAGNSVTEDYLARVDLLTSVFICLMSVVVLGLSFANGLINTRLDQSRFNGFVGWALLGMTTDALHAYWRMAPWYESLELLTMAGVQLVLLFWLTTYVRDAEHAGYVSFSGGSSLRSLRDLP